LAPPEPVRSLRTSTHQAQLRAARICYNHLAGALGTRLTEAMVARGWLTFDPVYDVLTLTPQGEQQAEQWGWTLDPRQRTPLVRPCLDWSERRYHVAGQVGRELAKWLFAHGWVIRKEEPRVVWVTDDGRRALEDWFGLSWPPTANQGGQLPIGERER
jgi:hypothetical protein